VFGLEGSERAEAGYFVSGPELEYEVSRVEYLPRTVVWMKNHCFRLICPPQPASRYSASYPWANVGGGTPVSVETHPLFVCARTVQHELFS
jgi:hypothetical protein